MKYAQAVALVLLMVGGATTTSKALGEQPQPDSLHFKRTGKGTFYHKENGGFEKLTGVPFDKLACVHCHQKSGQRADGWPLPDPYAPSCTDCHDSSKNPSVNSPAICLECHSRQSAEVGFFKSLPEPKDLGWQDLHVRRGMTCTSCHTGDQLHRSADGETTMLVPGAIGARCEHCHEPAKLSPASHAVHGDRLACAACHVKSVLTCNNCHFETELAVNGKFKRPISQGRGFVMLLNRKGSGPGGKDQVYPATYQSLVYKDKTFYTVAPFFSHTIMEKGRPCKDCHESAVLKEYDKTGKIPVATWNPTKKSLDEVQGIVPIPPDWAEALQFDFADFTGDVTQPGQKDKWVFLKKGADLTQMLQTVAAPLTKEQLDKLRTAVPETTAPRP
jgi:hypothetical protein